MSTPAITETSNRPSTQLRRVRDELLLAQKGTVLRPSTWRQEIEDDEPNAEQQLAAAALYDPHGNLVEVVSGTAAEVGEAVSRYVAAMAADGYPGSVVFEPGGPTHDA